jgi:type 1 fimbria pilin
MKKPLLLLIGMSGFTGISFAQSLSPQVVASSGNHFSNGGSQIEFTIGEVATSTLTAGGHVLTQGFHQPEIQFASLEDFADDYTFELYPNPTEQFITVTSPKDEEMNVHVYDANGKSVMVSLAFQKQVTLDLQNLAMGNYVLMISNGSGQPLHSYSIIKKTTY